MARRKKHSHAEARKEVLAYFDTKERPVVIGEVALHLGSLWSLDEVEAIFGELLIEGLIRHLTIQEARKYDLRYGFVRFSERPV